MTAHSQRLGPGQARLLALLLAASLAACGQRGPLYIPDEGRAEPPPEHPAELPANPETGTLPRDALEDPGTADDPEEVFADDFDAEDGDPGDGRPE